MFIITEKVPIEHVVEQAVGPLNEALRSWDEAEIEAASVAVVAWLRAFVALAELHDTDAPNSVVEAELWSALTISAGSAGFDADEFDVWTSVARELLTGGLRGIIYDDERVEHCANCYYWYLIGRGAIGRSSYDKAFLLQNAAIDLLAPFLDAGHVKWVKAECPKMAAGA